MTLVMVLVTIAVVGGVAAVATGLVAGGLAEPTTPIPARALPDRPLTGQDVADLRFVQAFRGYRMDQVDAAMEGLAAEIERLRALLPEGDTGPAPGSQAAPAPKAGSVADTPPSGPQAELNGSSLFEAPDRSGWPATSKADLG